MALFGRKKSAETPAAETGDPAVQVEAVETGTFEGDPRKARRFFDHAETVAEAKNYDYAIDLYIDGLKHDPDNMPRHEQLLEVAKRRKVAGGKKASLKDKLKSSGSDPVSKMLDAEKIWAMDFADPALMREFMKKAVEADEAEPSLNLGEVAHWIGSMALDIPGLKPKVKEFIQVRDLFARLGEYDKAVEACKKALRLDIGNQQIMSELKNLEAERYSRKNTENSEGGDFRGNIKDAEFAQEAQQGNTRAVSAVDAAIEKRRSEYEENPEDVDLLGKLVDALLKKEEYAEEEEAIKLLHRAHDDTGQYRYKMRAGDVKMKQFNRELRDLKKNLQVAPGDEYFEGRLKETLQEKQDFELGEYQERMKNYPTDLKVKYELGKRMYQAELIDEAIGLLQDAKREPKSKSSAILLLGRAFLKKGWMDEAIDTFAEGIEVHQDPSDSLGKELRYDKMVALLAAAAKSKKLEQAEEANSLASEILQADINYKDIKQKKQQASKLLDELRAE